jgi:hypothetical protein
MSSKKEDDVKSTGRKDHLTAKTQRRREQRLGDLLVVAFLKN